MEQGEAALCCRFKYHFPLRDSIPKILYFLITSVGTLIKPSAVAAQPRHPPVYIVDMFFITHTSIGRVRNFILQLQAKSDPFGT
jgi:hypothetical protein